MLVRGKDVLIANWSHLVPGGCLHPWPPLGKMAGSVIVKTMPRYTAQGGILTEEDMAMQSSVSTITLYGAKLTSPDAICLSP